MSPGNITFYEDRREHFKWIAAYFSSRSKLISLFRIVLFAGSLVLAVYLANERSAILFTATVVFFLISFALLVRYHNQVIYKERHQQHLSEINLHEIERIRNKLETFDPGSGFADQNHPYHDDLDIFGRHSLFQLLNRTTSVRGKNRLASWLSAPAGMEEIKARQDAVMELSQDIEFIQEFQASGMHYRRKTDEEGFHAWLQGENLILGKAAYVLFSYVNPPLTIALYVLYLLSVVPITFFFAVLLVNVVVLYSFLKKIGAIHRQTIDSIQVLQSAEARIRMLEKQPVKAALLFDIRACFNTAGQKASAIIGGLKRIFMNLENRRNMIYQLMNVLLLLDLHHALSAEKWKNRHAGMVGKWLDAVGEEEALVSLAGFAQANPDYVFPEITDTTYHFQAEKIGHPLISYERRVYNDFSLEGAGRVAMITGSNMAGKSTFLRTIGVNAVLALAGAPVCAGRLKISPLRIFTSMRTRDDLEENVSSFYAELRRIGQLLQLVNDSGQVFFLLDEILKGTNSKDRHLGAVSLVRQLSGLHTSGLISTHDLELAKETMKSSEVTNFSFESKVRGDEILFDYKLRDGICETFNASKLMEKMGIRLVGRK